MSSNQFKNKYDLSCVSLYSLSGAKPRPLQFTDLRRVDGVDYYPMNVPPNVINTYTGMGVEPLSVDDHMGDLQDKVRDGLAWVDDHLRKVIANNNEQTYIFVRNIIANILQRQGKLRVFLQVYSKSQQCGKGLMFDDFLGAILGANFYKPSSGLMEDEGLLGKFNWLFHSKLLTLLDENGEFIFNRAGHGKLRTWLSSKRVTYTQKGCTGIEMNDYSTLIALTNDLMSIQVEGGDARSAPISINEGYSVWSAQTGQFFSFVEATSRFLGSCEKLCLVSLSFGM